MNKQNKDYFISFRVTAEEKKWIENIPTAITASSATSFGTVSSKKTSLLSTVSMNSLHSFVASATMSTSSRELSMRDMQPRST